MSKSAVNKRISQAEQALYAVFSARRHMPIKVRYFVDFMPERFGGDTPYWGAAL